MQLKMLLMILIISFSKSLYSQEKSIHKKNVPPTVHQFISNSYPGAKHIKYYNEWSEQGTLIECEFSYHKEEISLVFKSDSLIETEISIDFEEIPNNTKILIDRSLDELFEHFKILEVQSINPQSNLMYEINVRAKNKGYFEVYFNSAGNLLSKKEIVLKPIITQF